MAHVSTDGAALDRTVTSRDELRAQLEKERARREQLENVLSPRQADVANHSPVPIVL